MTLTVIGPTFPFRGGISHFTSLMVRSMRARNDVRFYSYARQYPGWLYPGDSDRDTSCALFVEEPPDDRFDALNPFQWFRLGRKVSQSASKLVVLPWSTVYWTPFYWIFLRGLKGNRSPKIVFICHNVLEHEATWARTWVSRRVLTRADYFITHSHWDKRNLTRCVGESRSNQIRVSPHPRYEHLKQAALSKSEARALLGIRANRVLLFFGFIREYKGLRYLLESLPMIRDRLDVHLVIAGEVWGESRSYSELVTRLGLNSAVTFCPGYVPNELVERYFSAADLVVAPYVSATQSGIVQLAYGFGKPVIVGRVGGLPEAVAEGKTGYLVTPRDPSAIAAAVIDFYEHQRERVMTEAISDYRSSASWDDLTRTLEELGASA